MTRKKTASPLMAASAAAALLLVGCSSASSGGDEASQQDTPSQSPANVVYDFPLNGMPPASEGETLTIKLPDDLKETAGEATDVVAVDSFEVTSRELDSTKYCAVDVKVNYASDEARQSILSYYEVNDRNPDKSDGWKLAMEVVKTGDPGTMDEFDENEPGSGTYTSEDASSLVLVHECAKSPTDTETDITLIFPYHQDGRFGLKNPTDGTVSRFAEVDVAAMTDGTVSVASGEIKNWTRDSSGNWIED